MCVFFHPMVKAGRLTGCCTPCCGILYRKNTLGVVPDGGDAVSYRLGLCILNEACKMAMHCQDYLFTDYAVCTLPVT